MSRAAVTVFRLRVGERLGPAPPRPTARAGGVVGLLEFVRIGQIGVGLAGRGHGLVDRAAERKRVEVHLHVRAQGPTDLLQAVGAAAGAEIGDGKEAAVACPDADRVGPAARFASTARTRRAASRLDTSGRLYVLTPNESCGSMTAAGGAAPQRAHPPTCARAWAPDSAAARRTRPPPTCRRAARFRPMRGLSADRPGKLQRQGRTPRFSGLRLIMPSVRGGRMASLRFRAVNHLFRRSCPNWWCSSAGASRSRSAPDGASPSYSARR